MSSTEIHMGKLKEINMGDYKAEGLGPQISFLERKGYSFQEIEIEDNYFYSDEVCKIGNKWYEFIEHNYYDDEFEVIHAVKDSENNINFVVKFYNGGCSFEEALEEAIRNMRG